MQKVKLLVLLLLLLPLFFGCDNVNTPPDDDPKNPVNPPSNTTTFDDANSYVLNGLNKEVTDDFTLPTNYEDAEIEWISFDEESISSSGIVTRGEFDKNVVLMYIIRLNGEEKEYSYDFVVKGTKDPFEYCYEFYSGQIKDILIFDFDSSKLRTEVSHYDNVEMWFESTNEDIVENTGKIHRTLERQTVDLKIFIKIDDVVKEYNKVVAVKEESIGDVMEETIKKFENDLKENPNVVFETGTKEEMRYLRQFPVVRGDINLPNKTLRYDIPLVWTSSEEFSLSSDGKYQKPCIDTIIELKAKAVYEDKEYNYSYNLCLEAVEVSDKWEIVNDMLELICKKEITNMKFTMVGFNGDVPNQNYGYLPFYKNEKADRKQYIIPEKYAGHTYPGTKMPKVSWVTIHDTANTHADAIGHANYIMGGPEDVSWHFTVDDKNICQHLDTSLKAWHTATSWGNSEAIGIETCISEVKGYIVDYNKVMQNTAKLTAELLIENNLTINRVQQHNWFSGKDCPALIRATGRWLELLDLIKIELIGKTLLKDATFEWTSLSKDILSDDGRIINHPGTMTEVSYKVKVTIDSESKEFVFTSKVLPLSFEK